MENTNYADPNDILKDLVSDKKYIELKEDIQNNVYSEVLPLLCNYKTVFNSFYMLSPVDREFNDLSCKKCNSEQFRLGFDGYYFVMKCDNCKYEVLIKY